MLDKVPGNRDRRCRMGLMVLSAIAPMLWSCATPTPYIAVPQDSIPKEKGVIYIYQISGPWLGNDSLISVNDKPLVVMVNGGYYPFIAYIGENKLMASKSRVPPATTTVDVQEGQSYFVRCGYSDTMRLGPPQVQLTLVPKEIGEKEIATCELLKNE
jgi:hypothetical protein